MLLPIDLSHEGDPSMTSLFDPITFGRAFGSLPTTTLEMRASRPEKYVQAGGPTAGSGHPARPAHRVPLNAPNAKTFYTPGSAGYTDYPTSSRP
jgi:hypothetical protein